MAKRYKTLQKKLRELQSDLSVAVSLPPISDDDHERIAADFEQRLLFVTRLLNAEAAAASDSSGHSHLYHIARKIEVLEFEFDEWKNHREFAHAPDSVCSCDDDDDDDDVSGSENESSDLVDVEPEKEADCGGEVVAVYNGNGGGGGKIGSYFGGLITGMVLGMVLMGWAVGLELDDIWLPHYTTVHQAYLFPT